MLDTTPQPPPHSYKVVYAYVALACNVLCTLYSSYKPVCCISIYIKVLIENVLGDDGCSWSLFRLPHSKRSKLQVTGIKLNSLQVGVWKMNITNIPSWPPAVFLSKL